MLIGGAADAGVSGTAAPNLGVVKRFSADGIEDESFVRRRSYASIGALLRQPDGAVVAIGNHFAGAGREAGIAISRYTQ
jgi:hypothetical protein